MSETQELTPESLMLKHSYTSWPELLNDAELGAALRAALATVEPSHQLVLFRSPDGDFGVLVEHGLYPSAPLPETDATRALSALLTPSRRPTAGGSE